MPPNSHYRCWAEIDLAAFEHNLKCIQTALPANIRYVAVVKADAYGHGMPQIVSRLMQSRVDYFAVANVHEATEIRHMGAGWPILILSPVLPEETRDIIEYDLIATVSTCEEARHLNALGNSADAFVKIHLKIDTGMGRLGIWHEEARELLDHISRLPRLKLEGIYTHFSSADTDPAFTREQRRRFLTVLKDISTDRLLIHADNSSSLESLCGESPFNAVRVGLLQFGIPPYPHSELGRARMKPVLNFHTRVGLIKELPTATDISYGRTCRLKRHSKIAILTGGYGDGIPLELSNKGCVLIHGQRCPIIGRVTMDQTIVDVTELGQVQVGDQAILIGRNGDSEITATEFGQTAGTIPWDVLCSITKRVTRVYTGSRDI